jgi:hypothetical protein
LIAGSKVKKTKTVRKASANEMASSFNV